MKKIILTGGGTGGHCLPILVIYNSLRKKKVDCYIVTDKRGESFFSSINNKKIITIWQPVTSNKRISQLINLPIILFQSLIIFFKLKPNFTIGFGGYVTFPFLLSGSILGYKVAAHEANAVLGKANKYLMGRIKYLFTTFDKTRNVNKKFLNKIMKVGMPVRIYKASKYIKKNKDYFKICIIGGSQGAKSFSNVIPKAIIKFQKENNIPCSVSHQVRVEDLNLVSNAYSTSGVKYNVKEFFFDLPKIIFESDLIISRSGSSTVNEIIYYGKPAILIPYPYAVDNHQYYNALELEKKKIAKIILNKNLNVKKIYLAIYSTYKDRSKKNYISASNSNVVNLNPCERIYEIIKKEL